MIATSRPGSAVRLLALDIDGTLLDSRHRLTPGAREAIRSVAARGVVVVLASARGPSGLRALAAELGVPGYAVTFSGALLCRIGERPPAEVLGGGRMELRAARAVAKRGRELGVSIGWWDLEEWFVERLDEPILYEVNVIGVRPTVCDLGGLASAPYKLQCMVPVDGVERLRALREGLPPGIAAQFSNPNYLEVFKEGTDKAGGLLELGALLGIATGEMAAIGDGENDLAMLRSVGLGIAVANARESVREAAAWVTSSNDEDGVAAAILRMRREGRL